MSCASGRTTPGNQQSRILQNMNVPHCLNNSICEYDLAKASELIETENELYCLLDQMTSDASNNSFMVNHASITIQAVENSDITEQARQLVQEVEYNIRVLENSNLNSELVNDLVNYYNAAIESAKDIAEPSITIRDSQLQVSAQTSVRIFDRSVFDSMTTPSVQEIYDKISSLTQLYAQHDLNRQLGTTDNEEANAIIASHIANRKDEIQTFAKNMMTSNQVTRAYSKIVIMVTGDLTLDNTKIDASSDIELTMISASRAASDEAHAIASTVLTQEMFSTENVINQIMSARSESPSDADGPPPNTQKTSSSNHMILYLTIYVVLGLLLIIVLKKRGYL